MDLKDLISQKFQEGALFDLLLFEIEENLDAYRNLFFHIYLERLPDGQFAVEDIVYSADVTEFVRIDKLALKKRDYFGIYDNHGHIDMHLSRHDGSGRFAVISQVWTHLQEGGYEYADDLNTEPMTPDEMRTAFQQLAEIFQDHQQAQELRSKKAV